MELRDNVHPLTGKLLTYNVRYNAVTWSEELYRLFGVPPTKPTHGFAGLLERVHPTRSSGAIVLPQRVPT